MAELELEKDIAKIAKGAGITAIGEMSFYLLSFISTIIITNILGPDLFGLLTLTYVILYLGRIFSGFGLYSGVIRFISMFRVRKNEQEIKGTLLFCFKVLLSSSIVFAVFLFFASDVLSVTIFKKPELSKFLRFLAFSLPFSVLTFGIASVLRGFQAMREMIYVKRLSISASRLFLLACVFLLGLKFWGVLSAVFVSIVVGFVSGVYYLLKIFPGLSDTSLSAVCEKGKLMRFSLPLFFTGFLNFLIVWTDVLMIGYFLKEADLGVYSGVIRLTPFVILSLLSFNSIFAPMISELYEAKEQKKLENLFKLVTRWIFTISFFVFLAFALLGKSLLSIFGDKFAVGAVPLLILSAGQLVNAGVGSADFMLMMTGRSKTVLVNALLLASTNVILNLILIPIYGIIGAAIATATAIASVNLLRMCEIYYYLRIHPYSRQFIKPLLSGLFSAGIFYYALRFFTISKFSVALFVLGFGVLYGIFVLIFRLSDEDKMVIRTIREKIRFKGSQTS